MPKAKISLHFERSYWLNVIRKYENHQSIIKIKHLLKQHNYLILTFLNSDDISKIINLIDSTIKASGAIQIKIVKLANKKICKDLANCINECIKQNKFPNDLKTADIMPTFKKEDPLDKTNYRPTTFFKLISFASAL